MPRITVTLLVTALLALSGCSSLRFPGVYRIDIPQGNFVTEDMLAELKPGMTPAQITRLFQPFARTRFVLFWGRPPWSTPSLPTSGSTP